ncbi:hypothetical protein K0T92_20815 [Paenibacillus oenotherae]|uniref:ATP-grasp domain-containing protein n=1 Tax=Paenibacillus oenotherae TaxID=1435645 RepID=A0ABS7DBA0_9BACL|nr:hypothetical protein [Paenibacillus oenotherae]
MAIVSHHNDLHAHTVQRELAKQKDIQCHIIPSDRISESGLLTWTNLNERENCSVLPTYDGQGIDVREIDTIWYRRGFVPQEVGLNDNATHADVTYNVINNSSSWALYGLLLSNFRGNWINDPSANRIAENKAVQLKVAQEVGLATPKTLISSDPNEVRKFCSLLKNQVVVKTIRPCRHTPIVTQKLRPEHLASDESIRLCPAIYQEYIPGDRHLRVHVFGDLVLASSIESSNLDWRPDIDFKCHSYDLNETLSSKIRQAVQALNLKMGIVDLKLNGEEPTFLEINPQGQFLFVEALSGAPLTAAMAEFLYSESLGARLA